MFSTTRLRRSSRTPVRQGTRRGIAHHYRVAEASAHGHGDRVTWAGIKGAEATQRQLRSCTSPVPRRSHAAEPRPPPTPFYPLASSTRVPPCTKYTNCTASIRGRRDGQGALTAIHNLAGPRGVGEAGNGSSNGVSAGRPCLEVAVKQACRVPTHTARRDGWGWGWE
jgi:hypothetical protein